MIHIGFSAEMLTEIKKMKGDSIQSIIRCDDGFSRSFGNIRIMLKDTAIDIINDQKEQPFFDTTEDITGFELYRVSKSTEFVPMVNSTPRTYTVGETVESCEVVTDVIDVNQGEFQISFDMALIVRTSNHEYTISRDVWFSELITVTVDDSNNIYSVEAVADDWSNDGEYKVNVKRTTERIC